MNARTLYRALSPITSARSAERQVIEGLVEVVAMQRIELGVPDQRPERLSFVAGTCDQLVHVFDRRRVALEQPDVAETATGSKCSIQ